MDQQKFARIAVLPVPLEFNPPRAFFYLAQAEERSGGFARKTRPNYRPLSNRMSPQNFLGNERVAVF